MSGRIQKKKKEVIIDDFISEDLQQSLPDIYVNHNEGAYKSIDSNPISSSTDSLFLKARTNTRNLSNNKKFSQSNVNCTKNQNKSVLQPLTQSHQSPYARNSPMITNLDSKPKTPLDNVATTMTSSSSSNTTSRIAKIQSSNSKSVKGEPPWVKPFHDEVLKNEVITNTILFRKFYKLIFMCIKIQKFIFSYYFLSILSNCREF